MDARFFFEMSRRLSDHPGIQGFQGHERSTLGSESSKWEKHGRRQLKATTWWHKNAVTLPKKSWKCPEIAGQVSSVEAKVASGLKPWKYYQRWRF